MMTAFCVNAFRHVGPHEDVSIVYHRPDTGRYYYDLGKAVQNHPISTSVAFNLCLPVTDSFQEPWVQYQVSVAHDNALETVWQAAIIGRPGTPFQYVVKKTPPPVAHYSTEEQEAVAELERRLINLRALARRTNHQGIGNQELRDMRLYETCLKVLQREG